MTTATDDVIRHVIMDKPLRCWAQMMTAHNIAEALGAVMHSTAAVLGEPKRKRPGMSSGCMPRDPERGGDRCRHDLEQLRREGAIDVTADTDCWTPDGDTCRTCQGRTGRTMAYPDEYPNVHAPADPVTLF